MKIRRCDNCGADEHDVSSMYSDINYEYILENSTGELLRDGDFKNFGVNYFDDICAECIDKYKDGLKKVIINYFKSMQEKEGKNECKN